MVKWLDILERERENKGNIERVAKEEGWDDSGELRGRALSLVWGLTW